MHAAVARHYFSGGSFPIGGSSKIAATVDKVIENAGGTILISAEVDEVIINKNRATGVKMKDGKIFSAKNIISGAGIMTTYDKLLPKQIVEKHQLKKQLKTVKRSVSHACLYIGLKGSPEALKLPDNLADASRGFRQSRVAREIFGDDFVEHFAATREWEVQEFRKHITDWELARYFEII